MNILQLKNVGLTYFSDNGETKALENINLDIKSEEFVSIVGPSGCGKTTILSLISKIIKPTKGEIIFEKENEYIGYMFQKDLLFDWLTIEKNVLLGLEIQHKKTKQNIEYAYSLLKKYNIYQFKSKYPNQLSGGMRQRVSLIRTLVLKPKIMLLDEAFSALDYQTRLAVCDDVKQIITQEKITAVLVTHDIAEAISLSDRVVVLSNRPATIKNIHKIDIPNCPTPFLRRQSEQSKIYFQGIWEELQ